jgi:hypothetical protein
MLNIDNGSSNEKFSLITFHIGKSLRKKDPINGNIVITDTNNKDPEISNSNAFREFFRIRF